MLFDQEEIKVICLGIRYTNSSRKFLTAALPPTANLPGRFAFQEEHGPQVTPWQPAPAGAEFPGTAC